MCDAVNFKFICFAITQFVIIKYAHSIGPGMGMGFGPGRRGLGGIPRSPQVEIVGDLQIDMSNKFLQRITAGGTSYTPYTTPNGKALFRRRVIDTNRHFIVFPDNLYPPGSGHYIVLRKMIKSGLKGQGREEVYEAFNMYIGTSARAMILNWPLDGPALKQPAAATNITLSVSGSSANPAPDSPASHKGHHPSKHLGLLDVGEVVLRRKRKYQNEPIVPNFTTMGVSMISSGSDEEKEDEQLSNTNFPTEKFSVEEFDGFSIEPDE